MPKSETEQARLVCYSYGRECDLEAETAVSKVQNQQPEVLYLVESKGLKWQLQQIEEETACAVLDQAAELWEECFFLQQALCCDCSSGACVRRSPVQPSDFCTSLASHSSSLEMPYEYLLKTWEMSTVGLLHSEMNSSFSSAVYRHQTSIPSLGGPYRSPPSFHSPSANSFFFVLFSINPAIVSR